MHRLPKICNKAGRTGIRIEDNTTRLQNFIAFGDILELHKKFLELSGGINRVFELEELLKASQSSKFQFTVNLSASEILVQ